MSALINITIPVYNEERILPSSIARLISFLERNFPYRCELLIANNGSTDRTLAVAHELATKDQRIRVLHLSEKGRGRALKTAWTQTKADILTYMDVDLSTDLYAFPSLVEPLATGSHDLAVGSRLLNPMLTRRSLKRDIISRGYNLLVKAFFRTRFSDPQCGFKAITKAAASSLLPLVEDNGWFFDTELLVIAERLGYRIFDLPVRWVENADSRVKILRTALEDMRGLVRLRSNLAMNLSPVKNDRIYQPANLAAAQIPTTSEITSAETGVRRTEPGR